MIHPSYTELMEVINSDVEPYGTAGCSESLFCGYGDCKESQTDHRWRRAVGKIREWKAAFYRSQGAV